MQKKTLLAVLSGLSTKILKGLNATLTLFEIEREIHGSSAAERRTHTTKAAWLAHAREHSESYDGVW